MIFDLKKGAVPRAVKTIWSPWMLNRYSNGYIRRVDAIPAGNGYRIIATAHDGTVHTREAGREDIDAAIKDICSCGHKPQSRTTSPVTAASPR